jgi:hypothetical protein
LWYIDVHVNEPGGYFSMSQLFAESRRRNLRIGLFVIILATLPFYCIGFILWAAAPQTSGVRATSTPTLPPATREPTSTLAATVTLPPFVTPTSLGPLQPTPGQFFTPGTNITPILPPTSTPPPVFIPSSTPAPTLTPIPQPTNTPIPQPSNTPLPQPSNTPIPQPSNTPLPEPTSTPMEQPTSTTIPFFPTETETATPEEANAGSAGVEVASAQT